MRPQTNVSAWKDVHWGEPELKNIFEIDEVELVLPLSAISEKTPSGTVGTIPLIENDGEKSREKIIDIIRDNPTVTQLELSNMLKIIGVR